MSPRDLAAILAPCTPEEFFAESYGTSWRLVRGRPGKFAGLLSWGDLNRLLKEHHFPVVNPEDYGVAPGVTPKGRLLVAVGNRAVPAASFYREVTVRGLRFFRLDPAALSHQLRRGATLGILGVDQVHQPCADLADNLERSLQETVVLDVYASFRSQPLFGPHPDDRDQFVLQVSGPKRWQVYAPQPGQPTRDYPVRDPRARGELVWDGLLEDGDLLYLPRGWWHQVTPVGEPTLHLIADVYKRTGTDLLGWLTRQLRETSEDVRRDLPRFAPRPEQLAHLRRLRDTLLAAWDDELLDRYFREAGWEAVPRHPSMSLPWSATTDGLPPGEEALVRLLAPRAQVTQARPAGGAELVAGGLRLPITEAQARVLRVLVDGRVYTIARLCAEAAGDLDRAEVRRLLGDMISGGLVGIVDGEPAAGP
jgi:hypothetical protein